MMSMRTLLTPALLLAAVAVALVPGCGHESSINPENAMAPSLAEDADVRQEAAQNVGVLRGKIVVANRGSGSISVLDAWTGEPLGTYDLPAGPNMPEPMYVVFVRPNRVIVGDRANDRVVEFDTRGFSVTRTAPTGAGVFHMWVDGLQNRMLWVNNDIDNTATVIDTRTFDALATVPMPADLIAQGGKPHDVIFDPLGRHAFVTIIGVSGPSDYVVRFDTDTFAESGRAEVGNDAHVSLTVRNNLLYVPCQDSNEVIVLDRRTMQRVTTLSIPSAHGAGMTFTGETFYTTNITGGGNDAIYAIDTRTNTIVGSPADAPYAVPHNIALTPNGFRLFLTHSGGTSDKVTFYRIGHNDFTPVLIGEATVGLNPFGLAYVR